MNKLTVVMYHYVRNIEDSRYPGIKGLELALFIEQMEFFLKNYNIVRMEDVINCEKGKGELPEKSLLLTFDDGYREHFTDVYPILKSFGVQGSFFIPAKPILENTLLDVNKIHFILASLVDVNELLSDLKIDVNDNKNEFGLKDFNSYFNEYAIPTRFDKKEVIFIKRMLQHVLPETLRNKLTSKYFVRYVGITENKFSKELYMSTFQIKQLIRDGMHVGCHGYDHYWWNKLDPDSLQKEISKSKYFLQSLGCDMSNWTACYPYGSSSDEVTSELERQECNLAFTTEVNLVTIGDDSKLLFPRLDTNDFPPKSEKYKTI
jgi:peptidoglycan/xylan/chitin deacetylase (PgdA/CDA1 family)